MNAPRQGHSVVPSTVERDTSVVPELRELLRDAIEESGWKHEALAAAMGLPDRFYLSKLLSGEKPLGTKHLMALPDDVEALFAARYAKTFGLIVVKPLHGPDAIEAFVAGFVGVLTPAGPSLPERASRPVKAQLRPARKAAVNE